MCLSTFILIPKMNRTDLFFFARVNRSFDVLEYAGVDVSKVAGLFTNAHPFRRWNGGGIAPGERKMELER